MNQLPLDTIRRIAAQEGVDANLVAAFCLTESAGDPHATRFEPAYRWLCQPETWATRLSIAVSDEIEQQKTSFGLMQVMGAVARQLSFNGRLPDLCIPEVGVRYGCQLLKTLLQKYHTLDEAIAAYNAGSPRKLSDGRFENQSYVDTVKRHLAQIKAAK